MRLPSVRAVICELDPLWHLPMCLESMWSVHRSRSQRSDGSSGEDYLVEKETGTLTASPRFLALLCTMGS